MNKVSRQDLASIPVPPRLHPMGLSAQVGHPGALLHRCSSSALYCELVKPRAQVLHVDR